MPKTSSKKKRKSRSIVVEEEEEEADVIFSCSQVAVEPSQEIAPVKASEQKNLDSLNPGKREKVLLDLSRYILFKALAGEPIDRLKACKEAGITVGSDQGKISSAAFAEAAERLRNVFGYELKRLPKWMEEQKSVPKKYKETRLFVTSDETIDVEDHSKAQHRVHVESAIEKGLLMVILAFCYCKGSKMSDGSRWITDLDLYLLLNNLDSNIPAQPPTASEKKCGGRQHVLSQDDVTMNTPSVDQLLEQFVKTDYLLREKLSEDNKVVADLMAKKDQDYMSCSQTEEHTFVYAMGPRSALEIGRKQIVYFCSECMDLEVDPNMLLEFQGDEEEGTGGHHHNETSQEG